VTETLRAVPEGVSVRARFDSGFYSGPLFAQLEAGRVTHPSDRSPRILRWI
jgi:hypothetical protein